MKGGLAELAQATAALHAVDVEELLTLRRDTRAIRSLPLSARLRRERIYEARRTLVKSARRLFGMTDVEIAADLGVSETFAADAARWPRKSRRKAP